MAGTQPPAPDPLAPGPLLPTPTPAPGLGAAAGPLPGSTGGASSGAPSTPRGPLQRTPAALARAIRSQLAAGRSDVRVRFKPRTAGRLTVDVLVRRRGRSVRVARTRLAYDRPVEREVRVRLATEGRSLLAPGRASAKVRVTWIGGDHRRRTVTEAPLR